MTASYEIKNKNILVIGLARSGFSVARLLLKLGAHVTVNDQKPLEENKEAQQLKSLGVKVITGGHPLKLLDEPVDLIIKNPGIPYTVPLIAQAIKLKIPLITEVELATTLLPHSFIGITGTNGKTTTSELTAAILRQHFHKEHVYLAGNIGLPLSTIIEKIQADDQVILELSSFQLAGSPKIRPHIAAITNIYSAHLDYHKTQLAYESAKLHITENQTASDYVIYNEDLNGIKEKLKSLTKAQRIPFSIKKEVHDGVYLKDGWIYYQQEKVFPKKRVNLVGSHNLENVLVAVAIAKLSGVLNTEIETAVSQFHGVKHRTQFVKEVNGVKYYNDSKATNTQATIKALSGFSKSLILIAGGLDRGNDMLELVPAFKKYVKTLITFGDTNQKMANIGKKAGIKTVFVCQTVQEAVKKASQISREGDVILLSPANASWDQYKSFEDRGDDFIQVVEKLPTKGGN